MFGRAADGLLLRSVVPFFDQKYAAKIFGTFTRLHSKDAYEGAGLGLSICKKIVERHGGTIAAKSAANAGSVFEILLPVKR